MSRIFISPPLPSQPPRGFQAVPATEVDGTGTNPDDAAPIDWSGLERAAHDAAGWLLATLRTRTADPDDLAAIDRVERGLANGTAYDEADALTVAGLAIVTFERHLGIPGLSTVAGHLFDMVSSAPAPASACASNRPASTGRACEHTAERGGQRGRVLFCVPRGPRIAHGIARSPSVLQLVVG